MKRLLAVLSVLAVLAFPAWAQIPGGFSAPSYAWASKPNGIAGQIVRITDMAPHGSLWMYDTRWRPVGGCMALATLDADSAAINGTNTIVFKSNVVPSSLFQVGDRLRLRASVFKSGATDTTNWSVYVGSLGTTSDAAIISAGSILIAANRSIAMAMDFRIFSATQVQLVNNSGATTGNTYGYSSVTNSAVVGPVSLAGTDTTAVPLFFSVAIQAGATNSAVMRDAQLDYCATVN